MSYAFLDSEIKLEINKLIDKLCNSNFDFKKSYDNYFNKVNEIASYFSKEQANKIISTETEKMYSMLGNKLIRMMKEYKEITAEMLLFSLYDVISRLEEQESIRANSQEYIKSLSTNARKEWARKMTYGSDLEI